MWLAESTMQLVGFDSDTDDEDSSTPGSEEEDQALVPGSKAYMRLPPVVRRKLQELEGEVERLHDENALLKEVCASC